MDKKNKLSIKVILLVILTISSIFLLGFKITEHKTPNEMYAVYLNGNKIGTVKSKEDFNNYINTQEEKLKEKYCYFLTRNASRTTSTKNDKFIRSNR